MHDKKCYIFAKTRNIKNDQRILKEAHCIEKICNLELFVSSDCTTTSEEIGLTIHRTNLPAGATPKSLAVRALGAIIFSIKSAAFLKKQPQNAVAWICDPILFPLVLLTKTTIKKTKIIWDHHELPPDWVLSNKALCYIFKKAYMAADINIHTNNSRKEFLEQKIGQKHPINIVIRNYPSGSLSSRATVSKELEDWINKNKYVYLQNCLSENRCGPSIFKSVLESGYKILHAGNFTEQEIKALKIPESLAKKIHFAGSLNPKEIEYALSNCLFTVICYKKTSQNQTYCEPNRLYQAMAFGVPIIAGDNPTMQEALEDYAAKQIIRGDGSNPDDIKQALSEASHYIETERHNIKKLVLDWSQYSETFNSII